MTRVLALALVLGISWGPSFGGSEGPEDQEALEARNPETAEIPVKQIKMFAENWKWSPNLIRVPAGTRLLIEIDNVDAPHRFDMKKLGIKVALPEGEKTVVEILAEKPGTYTWRCSRPCGNGCPKMTGKLIVEKPSEH